jgi:hypothetical protein
MIRGHDPDTLLDKNGEIFAISTGADACTEHECGSNEMQADLCEFSGFRRRMPSGFVAQMVEALAANKPSMPSDDEIIALLRAGKPVEYPQLIERKSINRNLDKLVFTRIEAGKDTFEPEAVFGYSPFGGVTLDNPQLSLYRDQELAGAWDAHAFAVRVRGKKLVNKLERFAKRVKEGDGLFAGTFLQDQPKKRLSGVILAVKSGLRPEHRQAIAKAQQEWEAGLRLKAKSRVEELHKIFRDNQEKLPNVRLPGYIWPVWENRVVDGEVVYALNPDRGVDALHWGPYSFEELKRWILAEKKFKMQPLERLAA